MIYRLSLGYLSIEAAFFIWRSLPLFTSDQAIIFLFSFLLWSTLIGILYYLYFAERTPLQRRELLVNLTLMATSFAIVFLVVAYTYALVLNRKGYYDRHRLFFMYFRPDQELGYKGKPNLTNLELSWDLGEIEAVPHSTDELGFRRDESGHQVPIAVVGDSFGYGAWMADDETWSERLEDAIDIPVTNYAASGYSLWQYNKLIEDYIGHFENKLIIYAMFANDFRDDRLEESNKADYYVYKDLAKFQNPISYIVHDLDLKIDSPLSNLLRAIRQKKSDLNRIESVELSNGLVLFHNYTGLNASYFTDGGEQVVFQRLKTAIGLSNQYSAQMVVVIFPSKESVYQDDFLRAFNDQARESLSYEVQAYTRACQYLQASNVLCYDLTEDLRAKAKSSPLLYFEIDSHLNKLGNEISAQLIADFFRQKNLTTNLVWP